MLTLYDFKTSGNCYKARLALGHVGKAYRRVELPRDGSHKNPEYLAMNAMGQLPILKLEDGRVIADSSAIMTYLAEGTPYMPADPFDRAEVVRWLVFEQTQVVPSLAIARFIVAVAGNPPDQQDRLKAAQEAGRKALAVLEGHMKDHQFVAAGRYTIADMALYAYVHMAEAGQVSLDPYPAIRTWLGRVKAQKGFTGLMEMPEAEAA